MKVINEHFCLNKACPDYGKIGQGNIRFHHKYGKGGWSLLYCKTCKKSFSERRGTAFYGLHTEEETVIQVVTALAEGNGIRATGRIFNISKNTVRRIIKRVGQHCESTSRHLMKNLPVSECQLDELWSFVKKKRKISQNLRD